jgi:hypothetical protein
VVAINLEDFQLLSRVFSDMSQVENGQSRKTLFRPMHPAQKNPIVSYCNLITLDNSRELAALLRRANRIALVQRPPSLELAVINAGDELPPPSPWRLTIQVEPKRTVSPASTT